MRKILTFLFAALMSVGMFATTVTWNNNDITGSGYYGTSFTKDGVTITAGFIDFNDKNFMNDGTFTTTLGNFTKIEVTAEDVSSISGTGWSGNYAKKTWTGNASSVSFSGDFMGMGNTQFVFTIEEPATVAVTGVTLNQNEAQMTVGGETLTLTATVNPNNATDQSVSWSTSDANVATVDNGVVTAVAAGNATITVTTTDGSFTATCAVTVTAPEPEPQPTTVTWGATEFSSFGVDYLHAASRTVKGITVTVNAANQNFINVTEYGTTFNATIDNAFTFSTELGNITKIECTTLYAKGTLGDGWTIGANSATWEGNTNTLNFGNAGSMLVVSNIIFTIGGGSTPAPAEDVNITPNVDPDHAGVYYSTFYDLANKYALPAGVEAYVATLDGANLLLSKIADAGQTIPANNAVILKSSVASFTLSISDEEAVSFNAINSLQGTDVSIATPDNCYVLAGNEGVGFYHYTASMLNPHKAYVIYNGTPNQAPRRMPFIFDQATGVENVQGDNVQSTKVLENGALYIIKNGVKYNAQGQPVNQ